MNGQVSGMSSRFSTSSCLALVEAIPDAALVVDQQHLIVAANHAANEVLGAQLQGQPVALFLRSPDILNALSQTFSAPGHRRVALAVRAKVQRSLDTHLAPLGNGDNGRLSLIILRDKTREEQIERMRSDFVANASHELRTPLTTLSGFIDTMQGAASKDEKARTAFLSLMKTQAERMSSLIDDLLSLSRIELDEHLVPNATVDLKNIVAQTQNLLQSLLLETGCTLEIKLPAKMQVRGDANQLGQVVHNLIENAVKYSGTGKLITVSGIEDGPTFILSIQDNGPGIAAHHIPRLTERFYRVNVQDSRTRGGTGLGLAICKHIINRHRGQLVIESEVGRGSIFSIHLPTH
jgi:two-component system, OmpR family, phosphate regulon sensor histidine kinase PhoR